MAGKGTLLVNPSAPVAVGGHRTVIILKNKQSEKAMFNFTQLFLFSWLPWSFNVRGHAPRH